MTADTPPTGEHGADIDLTTVVQGPDPPGPKPRDKWYEANNSSAGYGGGQDDVPLPSSGVEFERVVGSQFEDHIVGGPGVTNIDAGPGADHVEGKAGAVDIYGGPGGDFLDGQGAGALHGGDGSDGCTGGTADPTCERSDSALVSRDPARINIALIEQGVPSVTPRYAALVVNGSTARDNLEASFAGGTITLRRREGPSFDASSVFGCAVVSADAVTCQVPGDQLDVIQLAGAGGHDVLRSTGGFPDTTSVMLLGGAGQDVLTTVGKTEDVLVDGPNQGGPAPGTDGREVLVGGPLADQLINNDGPDRLVGGAGDDVLLSTSVCEGVGDELFGGSGSGDASWAKMNDDRVFAEIGGVVGRPGGGGTARCEPESEPEPDVGLGTLGGVEDLEGSSQDDTLVGGNEANDLLGRAGADVLRGEGGSDRLVANDGAADTALDCGGGSDRRAVVDFARFNDPETTNCERPDNPKPPAYSGGEGAGSSAVAATGDADWPRLDEVVIGFADGGGITPSAFYRLDESSGSVVDDWTEGGTDGACVGGPTLRVPGAVADSGTAVRLDGANDYLDLTSAFEPVFRSGACSDYGYSIEMWVKFNSAPSGEQYLFSRAAGGNGTFVYRAPDGRLTFKTTTAGAAAHPRSRPTIQSAPVCGTTWWRPC